MQTRREALVAQGLAKMGRGKFSKDALAWLDAQRAKGVKFSDDDAPVKPAKVNKETRTDEKPTAPVASDPRNTPYLFPDEYRFPEAVYRACIVRGGKKVEISLRECCKWCRVSLVNHSCETPTWLDQPVTIEKR